MSLSDLGFMTLSQTAMIHGEPGERARTTGILRLFYPFLFTGVAIGFFIGLAFPSHRTLAGVGLLLTAAALIEQASTQMTHIECNRFVTFLEQKI